MTTVAYVFLPTKGRFTWDGNAYVHENGEVLTTDTLLGEDATNRERLLVQVAVLPPDTTMVLVEPPIEEPTNAQ